MQIYDSTKRTGQMQMVCIVGAAKRQLESFRSVQHRVKYAYEATYIYYSLTAGLK